MSTPADKVDTSGSDDGQKKEVENKELTFDQKVNNLIDASEIDDRGNIVLPEDTPDELKFASRAEKRRRDTQSALAKTTSALSISQAENEGLTEIVRNGKVVNISTEEVERLKELKFSDPDAWRDEMNLLEQKASTAIDSQLSDNSEKAKLKGITGERKVLLDAFIADNPNIAIDDEVLANDIPPRITQALENGEISFIDFLGKVKEYLTTGKVIKDDKPGESPNLSNIGGSDVPGDIASKKDSETRYEDQMF